MLRLQEAENHCGCRKPIGLRIRDDYLEAVKQVAERKGIPPQTLIQMWLVERQREEAPELLQK